MPQRFGRVSLPRHPLRRPYGCLDALRSTDLLNLRSFRRREAPHRPHVLALELEGGALLGGQAELVAVARPVTGRTVRFSRLLAGR